MIAPGSALSVARQAKLLGVSRSSVYYRPRPDSQEELDLLKRLDELFTENPVYGSRRLQQMLKRQHVRVKATTIPAADGQMIHVTCLIATEIDPPPGRKPVEWRLLTNRAAADLDAAVQLIDWYRCRWEIETLFHVLKNGCRVEALQLGSMAKLELALAVYLVVSWRLARLIRLGRIHPEWPADLFFSKTEWTGAFILNKKKPPAKTPTVREVVRLTAQLGGFLARKGDGEPGVKSLWIGIQALRHFVCGVEHSRKHRYAL